MPASIVQTGFSAAQLKLIAMLCMTIDHMGLLFFPGQVLFRIVGRLALPIYAYFIAEGCRRTRSRGRYFLRIFSLAAVCQAVYFFAQGSLYMCILVTFSLSIALICAIAFAAKQRTVQTLLLALAAIAAAFLICEILPVFLPGFAVDYGFIGVLLPVIVYFAPEKTKYLTAGLIILALRTDLVQYAALAAIPMLGMYNGQRGSARLGRFFYFYYPAHLVLLYGLSLLF